MYIRKIQLGLIFYCICNTYYSHVNLLHFNIYHWLFFLLFSSQHFIGFLVINIDLYTINQTIGQYIYIY